MAAERNRTCKTGFHKSAAVEGRRSCICPDTKGLFIEKRLALKSALTSRVNENKFIVVDEIKFDEIKTKRMVAVLKALNAEKALVVLNNNDDNVILSARNIPTVKVSSTGTISVYDILKYNTMIVTKDALAAIEEVYA